MGFQDSKAEHGHLDLVEQGLIIDQSCFYLGISPDGLCNCKKCGQFLIEIKCPYTKRNISPKHAAKDHCYEDQSKNLHLDPKSAWYYQIQGEFGICKLDLCKLVVYTTDCGGCSIWSIVWEESWGRTQQILPWIIGTVNTAITEVV